jgi:hypothetical protein
MKIISPNGVEVYRHRNPAAVWAEYNEKYSNQGYRVLPI